MVAAIAGGIAVIAYVAYQIINPPKAW